MYGKKRLNLKGWFPCKVKPPEKDEDFQFQDPYELDLDAITISLESLFKNSDIDEL